MLSSDLLVAAKQSVDQRGQHARNRPPHLTEILIESCDTPSFLDSSVALKPSFPTSQSFRKNGCKIGECLTEDLTAKDLSHMIATGDLGDRNLVRRGAI